MSRRANQSPEARERERQANRERMRKYRESPEYVERVNAVRRHQDATRKASDPELKQRLRSNGKRHYERRKGDPDFWAPRKEYHRRWIEQRRENEAYEAFMERIEQEEAMYAES